MCSMNEATSAPNSATRKGTRLAIRPAMKWTSREPVELGDQHGAAQAASSGQRRGELGPAVEGVRPLAVSTSVKAF